MRSRQHHRKSKRLCRKKSKLRFDRTINYLTAAAKERIEIALRSLEVARKLSAMSRHRCDGGKVDLFATILREQQ